MSSPSKGSPPLAGPARDALCILAIDDEAPVRDAYRRLLSRAGHRVQAAATAEEALHCLERQSYDLILLDLRMPRMDGAEFLRRLKRQKRSPEVLVVSGYATIEDAVEVTKLGAYGVIEKFKLPQALLTSVERILSLRIDPLISYIRAHFDQIDSREEVARHFEVSPRTISNRIKCRLNQSFPSFLQSCRIREAQWLLAETDLRVKQIAERVGFHSPPVFSRTFHRLTGRSPRQYREEVRAKSGAVFLQPTLSDPESQDLIS